MTYTPTPIREWRHPSPWVTCTIDSGTMGAAKASRGAIAATGAEADRLWDAIGRGPSGYTSGQLRSGQQQLYRHQPVHFRGSRADLLANLQLPGAGLVLYGSYPRLPLAIRQASRQPGYTGLHAIYVQPAGAGLELVLDPLGRVTPVPVPAGSLLPFAGHLETDYEHDLYIEGSWSTVTTITVLRRWDPPAVIRFTGPATYRGYLADNPSPQQSVGIGAGGSWANGDRLALIEQGDPAAAPRGTFAHIVNGALAGLWVPASGLQLPPESTPVDRATLARLASRLRNVARDLEAL